MAYSREDGRERITRQMGGVYELAKSIGQHDGGGVASQHQAAIDFWNVALSLQEDGEDAVPFDRDFARSEITRHQAALVPLPMSRRPDNGAV